MGRDVRAWVEAAVMACQIVARRPVFFGEFEAASSVNILVKLTVGQIGREDQEKSADREQLAH